MIAAIHEATITMRDTTIEISKISRDLKEKGMIKDTAKTLDETVAADKWRVIQTNGGRYERERPRRPLKS